jgi:perosamine synthetase
MIKESNAIRIPVYEPFLSGRVKEYVNRCLDSNWISSRGEFISRFERSFSKYLNVDNATTVSNGTVALHLALHALGIGSGDEVIVPTLTYVASINSIAYVGATPIFVDSCENSWNIDPEQIVSKITEKTKAIMVVHLYGNPCAMKEILNICKQHNLLLIEDAAEAFGSKYNNSYIGTFGDVSTFSFFGNKTITTGEGGMIVSNVSSLGKRISKLKNHAVSLEREYWHDEIGFNYRMTNICAAIGVAQLEDANNIIEKKRQLAEWYKAELDGTSLVFQFDSIGTINTYWMVSVVAKSGTIRDGIRAYLKEHGVETRPFFVPAHVMPVFRLKGNAFPVAESLGQRGLNLPSYPGLTRKEISYICSLIKDHLN